MLSIVGSMFFRNRTTSVISALVIVAGVLFTWHKVDKGSAVRRAVMEYVADTELKVERARIAEIERRARIAVEAADQLRERTSAIEGELSALNGEIEAYEAETEIPASGRVGSDLVVRLRGN